MLILLFISFGCESKKHKQIKAMMEVGEYTQAITLIKEELLEDVKNIKFRKMLLKCFEKQQSWYEVINQIHIINRINPEINYDFLLLRAYSLNQQFDKVQTIMDNYSDYDTTVRLKFASSKINRVIKFKIHSDSLQNINAYYSFLDPDSLHDAIEKTYCKLFDGDSLLEKKFFYYFDTNRVTLEKEMPSFFKKNHLNDWLIAIILLDLYDDFPYLDEYELESLLQIDSTYIDYIYHPLMVYVNSIKEPVRSDFKYGSYRTYDNAIRYYHSKRSRAFEFLNLYEKALEEKRSEIYWSNDKWLSELYREYVRILTKMNDYNGIIYFIDEKIENHKGSTDLLKELNEMKIEVLSKLNHKST